MRRSLVVHESIRQMDKTRREGEGRGGESGDLGFGAVYIRPQKLGLVGRRVGPAGLVYIYIYQFNI